MRKMSSTTKLLIFLVGLGLISYLASLYVDWLWFKSVSYQSVFSTILLNKVGLFVIVFLATILLFAFNLNLTKKHMGMEEEPLYDEEGRVIYLDNGRTPWKEFLRGEHSRWLYWGISLLAAYLVSSVAAENWLVIQQYINRVPFGNADPVFSKDIGFYFFNLAFYKFAYGTLMMALILLLITLGAIYLINASTDLLFGDWRQFSFAKGHLATLLAAVFLLKSWGYKLAAYDILFSPTGVVYGATYSDIFARLLSLRILLLLSIIIAAVILANIFVKKLKWILFSIGAWVLVAFLMGGVYPSLVQKLVVQPNEFNKEKPYIVNAIKYTRQAYGLDRAENRGFNIDYNLDITDPDHQSTIDNIRLWDWQPLRTTYKNLQQLRSYYVFDDVDIDRYTVDGQYRQLMLSVREIDQEELPQEAKTWVNQRLMYTHGYGLVVSPVTEVAEEGFPEFFVKDIPPRFSTDLKIERPEIYFGEKTDNYVIVNTKQKEFDYPAGEKNVFTIYEGKDGIQLKTYAHRLLFAWVLRDYKMLLSSDITNSSQILMNRNILERVQKIAPYLSYDGDPYIVINDDGRLYWVLDAYTVSDKYPYSEPFDKQRNNYLRNSVKIICNAYDGKIDLYIADETDPIIKTYSRIFPQVYKPLTAMPEGLRLHLRYPVDMFSIQAQMYRTFHMTDPSVFYNKEDPWLIPNEIVDDKSAKMEPYYLVMHLPEEKDPEYILMMPFTPKSRANMVGWMCARMDGDHYGKMLVYNFPKQETIYGPEQIESRINQNTEIAQQLSLWDQRGSRVYRGNLLVIPMGNSILYVEPLYLQAENNRLPELKRVLAAFENKVVMEPSLDMALLKLFGQSQREEKPEAEETISPGDFSGETVAELANSARKYYDKANQLLRDGDWSGYGENIKKLNDTIRRLEEAVKS